MNRPNVIPFRKPDDRPPADYAPAFQFNPSPPRLSLSERMGNRLVEFFVRWSGVIGVGLWIFAAAVIVFFAFQMGRGQ